MYQGPKALATGRPNCLRLKILKKYKRFGISADGKTAVVLKSFLFWFLFPQVNISNVVVVYFFSRLSAPLLSVSNLSFVFCIAFVVAILEREEIVEVSPASSKHKRLAGPKRIIVVVTVQGFRTGTRRLGQNAKRPTLNFTFWQKKHKIHVRKWLRLMKGFAIFKMYVACSNKATSQEAVPMITISILPRLL